MKVISPHKKTAIILFNLGGPDGPQAVQPFLFNLFNDPAIIGLPSFFRKILAKYISKKRAPVAQKIYKILGNRSPIVPNTIAQAEALSRELKKSGEVEIFICMRYWHPQSAEVVKKVESYAPDHILLMPLYPQFSTTTTESSFLDWQQACKKIGLNIPTTLIGCYPVQEQMIQAHAQLIREALGSVGQKESVRLLFSAHGLPEKIIKKGDPYQWQIEQTTQAIVATLAIENIDYVNCYQSRVGPMKWIGPSTEHEIKRAGPDGKTIILIPVAFVSEHSETLVELDVEYKEIADHHHVPHYHRVPTLSVHPHYIQALAQMCLNVSVQEKIRSNAGTRLCPQEFSRCLCYPNKEGNE